MDKRFLSILVILIIIFGGIFFFSQKSSNGSNKSNAPPSNHVIGKNTTGVTLVEYGDYECPVCEGYSPVVNQVRQVYANKIAFQFRNLPLSQVHPNAFAAARAAEAAALQNKFWQMHDLLYQSVNWQAWTPAHDPTSYFNSYAQQLGLNIDKFKTDSASSQVNDTIQADLNAFSKTGQQEATPTFFINGQYVSNDKLTDANHIPLLSKFEAVLNQAIASAKK